MQDAQIARQWAQWDKLITTQGFQDFIIGRDLTVRSNENTPYRCIETEQVAIGAMLMEREAAETACRILHYSHFSMEAHQRTFLSIARQAWKPQWPIDIETTVADLRQRGWLEKAGGPAYLIACIDSCPNARAIAAYAEIIVQAAQRRALQRCAELITASTASAEGRELNLATVKWDKEYVHSPAQISTALRKFCDAIEAMPQAQEVPDLEQFLNKK